MEELSALVSYFTGQELHTFQLGVKDTAFIVQSGRILREITILIPNQTFTVQKECDPFKYDLESLQLLQQHLFKALVSKQMIVILWHLSSGLSVFITYVWETILTHKLITFTLYSHSNDRKSLVSHSVDHHHGHFKSFLKFFLDTNIQYKLHMKSCDMLTVYSKRICDLLKASKYHWPAPVTYNNYGSINFSIARFQIGKSSWKMSISIAGISKYKTMKICFIHPLTRLTV